jgi:DNA repair protein RadA/Sms
LDPATVYIGEVGLNGEVRRVPQVERRLGEASRHGFTRALVPGRNADASEVTGIEVVAVDGLRAALAAATRTPARVA